MSEKGTHIRRSEVDLFTAARMRAAETRTIGSGAVTGHTLMERAGQGVVAAIRDRWPDLSEGSMRAIVLSGPGNNGGDGFVVARLLKALGWRVEVAFLGVAARLPEDARRMHDQWAAIGRIRRLDDSLGGIWGDIEGDSPDLIVDALFGTGLSRPLDADLARTLGEIALWRDRHGQPARVVAVDLPSGLCSDSGRSLGAALPCDLTVTFHRAKCGHYLAEGPVYCGEISIVDIGLPDEAAGPDAMPPRQDGAALVSAPSLRSLDKSAGHKFDHGHALILSGGVGRGGAARLAARAALRSGAGLVTLGCPPAALIENAARLDAVMLRRVDDGAAWAAMLAEPRITAVCLGPGLGTGAREIDLLRETLTVLPRPTSGHDDPQPLAVCLDADALTLLGRHPDLKELLHPGCLLTPHGGEFARLVPDLAARLDAPALRGPAFSRIDAVRAAAAQLGCTILLKGPDTVIADSAGRCWVHSASRDNAAPWLATAGSGDVLAGIITGLMARGHPALEAAKTGAWLHAACARRFGPGLIAEDLPDQLPAVFGQLGL